jgi:hypothetical protein
MHLASVLRRRAFRDGYSDGKRGRTMRRLTERRERYHYALGRIFANLTPAHVRIFNQRQVTTEALTLAEFAKRKGFLRA